METKFDFQSVGKDIVYVKPVSVAELNDELREKAGDLTELFAVHNSAGEQLALVADHDLAFHLARENHMRPVSVH